MSEHYEVLARKYRPHNFKELVGQTHTVRTLVNALDNDNLHHGFLFTGTRGVGKTTIARIFAKSVNCEKGVSSNPCGKCATCVEIDKGQSVDLIELDAASHTGVDHMREILDNAQYTPTKNLYKIYLIDEVHMLSKSAFNAMLKTLEEPPNHVKFILATTEPKKVPITVLSRCLQFNLKQMTVEKKLEDLDVLISTIDMKRIIEHLIFNAFYYSPSNSKISVSTDTIKRELVVIDQGIGMTQETIQKIKQGPYRGEEANQFHQKGTLILIFCDGSF